eukprot:s1036_g2.t1
MASSQYFKMVAMFPILELAWPLFVGSSYSAIDTALNPVPTTARLRRIAQGRFNPTEGRCCILGASHGPVVFRLGIPFVPSLEEMQAGLSRIDACPPRFLETFWAGVACAGSAIFVSAPTQAVHRTVVVKERSSKRRNNQGVSEKGIKQEWEGAAGNYIVFYIGTQLLNLGTYIVLVRSYSYILARGTSSVQVRVAEKMLGCETCGVISGFTL